MWPSLIEPIPKGAQKSDLRLPSLLLKMPTPENLKNSSYPKPRNWKGHTLEGDMVQPGKL